MARLYVFGVGGTGARVIKSLTMLMAAGLDINNYDLVPILVDPDQANGDLNRTALLLDLYQQIRPQLEHVHNRFFKTPLIPLPALAPQANQPLATSGFHFTIPGSQTTFRNFIGYDQLSPANQGLMDLLYTEDNLNAQMDVGFKGNPNMGSVVLNQIQTSDDFQAFASAFQPNDRIFVISSIFGGTGAAGFPLLVNNIRQAGPTIPNFALLKDSVIGALTVLPYFTLTNNQDGQNINANTFVSKSIAALSYYNRNLNNSLNALYSIGDTNSGVYSNHAGGQSQQNDAHFVELAGALAVIDFARQAPSMLPLSQGATVKHQEFGVVDGNGPLHFGSLGNISRQQLTKGLGQFKFWGEYLRLELNQAIMAQPAFTGGTKITSAFLTQSFYKDLLTFQAQFDEWLTELAGNTISFAPFRTGTNRSNLFTLIAGINPTNLSLADRLRRTENFDYFNKVLQEAADNRITNLPAEQKFGAIFFKATEAIMNNRFNC